MIEKFQKLSGGAKFMLFMIVVYLIAGVVDFSFAASAFHGFLANLSKLLPIMVFVYVIIFIVNLFLHPEKIKHHLGHDSGLKGWAYASLGSVLIITPPYVMFPLLGQLKEHGMKYSLMAVFLGNRNVQPAFLPVMVYYFGLSFTIVVSCYILAFSILSGIIMSRIMREYGSVKIG